MLNGSKNLAGERKVPTFALAFRERPSERGGARVRTYGDADKFGFQNVKTLLKSLKLLRVRKDVRNFAEQF